MMDHKIDKLISAIGGMNTAYLEEAIAFELRQKFVQSLTVTQKNVGLLLRGSVIGITAATALYKSPDRNKLLQLLGVDPDGRWDEVRKGAVSAVTARDNDSLTPAIIYAQFQDGKANGYHSNVRNQWPKHEENLMLDALYAWLTLMGYEMSDDEKALQNGTHPLFTEQDAQTEEGGKADA